MVIRADKLSALRCSVLWLSLPDTQPNGLGRVAKRDHSFFRSRADVRVIRDQDVSIDIKKIGEIGEVSGGGYQDAGFDHASDHGFEASLAGGLQRIVSAADAAGL